MRLEEIGFCRGFALWKARPCMVPGTYRALHLPSGHVFAHDNIVESSLVSAPDGPWVLIAGTAIDVDTGEMQLANISRRLLTALRISEEALFDRLDMLSGRFVIVYCTAGSVRVLHDACGTRSVFHSADSEPIVASHHNLIANALTAAPSEIEIAKLPYKFGYPGRGTPAEGVFMLMPNCLLDLSTGKVRRYFPRGPVTKSSDIADVVQRVIADVSRQLCAVAEKYPRVTTSLTAGRDSRFTLATARPFTESMEYFTYRRPGYPPDEMDASVAQRIAKQLKLSHHLIQVPRSLSDSEEFSDFDRFMELNSYYPHLREVAYLYWKRYSTEPTLHLRSNLAEIGRAFYRKLGMRRPLTSPTDMTKLFHGALSGKAPAEAAFADFFEATEFGSIYDYDPYDMFYWEHRMGTWHALVLIESDPAFETHIVFNARRILQAMLSLPLEERLKASVFSQVIQTCWPALSKFPFNPEDWLKRYGEARVGIPRQRRSWLVRWPVRGGQYAAKLAEPRKQGESLESASDKADTNSDAALHSALRLEQHRDAT